MLNGTDHEMISGLQYAEEREIVALCAAARKGDLAGLAADQRRYLLTRGVYGATRAAAKAMHCARIAETIRPEGLHRCHHFRQDRCRRVRVHVDTAHVSILLADASGGCSTAARSLIAMTAAAVGFAAGR